MLFIYKMGEKLSLINFCPDLFVEGNNKQHSCVPGKRAETWCRCASISSSVIENLMEIWLLKWLYLLVYPSSYRCKYEIYGWSVAEIKLPYILGAAYEEVIFP